MILHDYELWRISCSLHLSNYEIPELNPFFHIKLNWISQCLKPCLMLVLPVHFINFGGIM